MCLHAVCFDLAGSWLLLSRSNLTRKWLGLWGSLMTTAETHSACGGEYGTTGWMGCGRAPAPRSRRTTHRCRTEQALLSSDQLDVWSSHDLPCCAVKSQMKQFSREHCTQKVPCTNTHAHLTHSKSYLIPEWTSLPFPIFQSSWWYLYISCPIKSCCAYLSTCTIHCLTEDRIFRRRALSVYGATLFYLDGARCPSETCKALPGRLGLC